MKLLGLQLLIIVLVAITGFSTCEKEEPAAAESSRRPTSATAPFPNSYPAHEFREWNDRVYYQIFVRSFYDSDSDGIGDLRGIVEKLDYLNDGDSRTIDDLGVRGIWLMPINASPSYHGYDVSDYYSIQPEYGTLDDFRELLSEAKKRGIHIIMDMVLNHSSIEHPWFLAARQGDPQYKDYYIWQDSKPGVTGPWGQQVWHSAGNGTYYYGLFWSGMPDLNYWNPALTEEMHTITRFWLEDVGVHGFRLDAIMYLKEEGTELLNTPSNHEWFQEYYNYYKGINPRSFTIGEAWTKTKEAVKYVGSEVDVTFEFDLASAILTTVRQQSYTNLLIQQEKVLDLYPHGQYGRFLTNHDQTRSATVFRGDPEKQKLAASLLLTGPGIPFIYYGEEIGVEGGKPDENLRRPMHWSPDGGFSQGNPWQDYAAKLESNNVAGMDEDAASLLNRYRALIQLRNASPALRRGVLTHLASSSRQVYAYFLHSDTETLLVVHNLGAEQDDYALHIDTSPFTKPRLAPLYLGNSAGNFTGTAISPQLGSPLQQPKPTRGGGFENYRPLPILQARATYIFRIHEE